MNWSVDECSVKVVELVIGIVTMLLMLKSGANIRTEPMKKIVIVTLGLALSKNSFKLIRKNVQNGLTLSDPRYVARGL